MSIFKRLFGGSEHSVRKSGNTKFDLDTLLLSEDINKSIIELDNYVSKLCSYGEQMDKLSEVQKQFFLNQKLERELNNGGFSQYFFNSGGNFAHQTLQSLKAIGANKTADILQKAIDQFPDKVVPRDRTERQEILEQIEETAEPFWEDLEQQFYTYRDDLNQLNIEYIRQHKDRF